LSKISAVDGEAIKSFAIDLGRPLLLAGDSIQFFDEPAETWFRENFLPSSQAMNEFITSLKPLAAASPYVASVLPQLMLGAQRFSDLVELALTSAALPDTSPLEKRDVELQRLQFALKAGLRSKRYLDAAKLALKAGGETAGDDRRRNILQAKQILRRRSSEATAFKRLYLDGRSVRAGSAPITPMRPQFCRGVRNLLVKRGAAYASPMIGYEIGAA
jgi:hypothetical protein